MIEYVPCLHHAGQPPNSSQISPSLPFQAANAAFTGVNAIVVSKQITVCVTFVATDSTKCWIPPHACTHTYTHMHMAKSERSEQVNTSGFIFLKTLLVLKA